MMNSFIAWIGGKKLLRKTIIERFPEDYDRYIEVFGGAGWVLFGREPDSRLEVFNDANGELINLYRCIKYHCEELQKELQWLLVSREQFVNAAAQVKCPGLTDIQRAARYFHLVKISFGSDTRTFGTNKKNLSNTIEYLPDIQQRLRNVVVENKDFENLIKVYDRPKALFYLDPPYYGTEKHYDAAFSKEDHLRLQSCLKSIKGKFVLSYNDSDFIRDLYSDFQIEGVERTNNLVMKDKVPTYKEVIITNY